MRGLFAKFGAILGGLLGALSLFLVSAGHSFAQAVTPIALPTAHG
jgi:hypothetical protein